MDSSSMSLPVYRGSADHLRNGFRSLDCENRASHPIAEMQRKDDAEFREKLERIRNIHGSALAMTLATERRIFGQRRRHYGLESSNIAVETVMGAHTTIEFQDFLDQPDARAETPKIKLYDALEVQYGLQ